MSGYVGWLLLPFRLPVVSGSDHQRVQISIIHSLALAPSSHFALCNSCLSSYFRLCTVTSKVVNYASAS